MSRAASTRLSTGIGGHHSARMRTDEWLTPPSLLRQLGPFDLDPCSPVDRPWDTAARHYSIKDDGLAQRWDGRVWMNPPYGQETARWLAQLARHGDGLALIFARTETDAFHRWVWQRAAAVFFLRGRLNFHFVSGDRCAKNAGAPSVLIGYGAENADCLRRVRLDGIFIDLALQRIQGGRA